VAIALLLGGVIAHLSRAGDARSARGHASLRLMPTDDLPPARAASPEEPPEAEAPPARDDAKVEEAQASLKDVLRVREAGSGLAEIQRAEREFRERLDLLGPHEVVDVLLEAPRAPIALGLVLHRIDRGLERDRAAWEIALVVGVEKAGEEVERLEWICDTAVERVGDEARREQAALYLVKRAESDRLLVHAARFAAGEAVEEVRDLLWSKVPAAGAIEGLGYLVRPDEAPKVEALGASAPVLRALENAYRRTGDPAFRDSLVRLGQ
jgi:hypothetical protein